jgi:aspartyl-tRNA(Asn)/glutamyl-tRNA(Gln) amidotransferase subunit C
MADQSSSEQTILNTDMVQRVARLARLAPTAAEQEQLRLELGAILDHFQNLASLDTTDTQPAYHPQGLENRLRDDVVLPSLDRAALMALAPRHKDGCLMVPRTVE